MSTKTITVCGIVVLIAIVAAVAYVCWKKKHDDRPSGVERFTNPSQPKTETIHFNSDQVATGIERPLWGPLLPLEKKNDNHFTLHSMPWCLPTLTQYAECQNRTIGADECRTQIPYEQDKI